MINYIVLKSCDNVDVFVDKEIIINNAVVISRMLHLQDGFKNEPRMEGDKYLFFDTLHHKSIIFIIKYLSVFQTDFKKDNDFISFIQNLREEHFVAAVDFVEPYCVFIPSNLWKLLKKPPVNPSEDMYGEYSFINLETTTQHHTFLEYLKLGYDIAETYKDDKEVEWFRIRRKNGEKTNIVKSPW